MPCGITQCYLPPGSDDIPPLPQTKLVHVLDLATPEGCKTELTEFTQMISITNCYIRFILHILHFSFKVVQKVKFYNLYELYNMSPMICNHGLLKSVRGFNKPKKV